MSAVTIRFDEYELDLAGCELRKRGKRVELQRIPFRILELLVRRPGELVTREELFRFLWPNSHVSFERSLNTAISSLRHALQDSTGDCHLIETRRGIGYRFRACVEHVAEINPPRHVNGRNRDAYEDCLKGRYFLDSMCEQDVYKAIGFFNSAVSEPTCFSSAHAGIAEAYCQLAMLGSTPPHAVSGRARRAAEIALKHDPDLTDAHVALARVRMTFEWDWQDAQEEISRALAFNPNAHSAYTLQSWLLLIGGHYDEAREACSRALSIDPLCFPANLQLAACLYGARDFERAMDQCWKILTLAPRFAPAQIVLAMTYEQLAMYDEALIEFRNAQSCSGFEPSATSGIGQIFAVMGLDAEAEQTYVELSSQSATRYVSPYWYALILAEGRQQDKALSLLEDGFRERDPALLSLGSDARFQPMAENDRFQMMVRGLTQFQALAARV